jgi:hypothetical protein
LGILNFLTCTLAHCQQSRDLRWSSLNVGKKVENVGIFHLKCWKNVG